MYIVEKGYIALDGTSLTITAVDETTFSVMLIAYTQARIRFNADVFWSKASVGQEMLDLWLDTYQVGKDFKRRGIVEVIIS